jgi:CubicO group peptidase (beta-lactamase class C family)
MRQRIFQPLGMKTAGFGGTGTVGQIDQPWPHFHSNSPAPTNGPTMDIPAFWGPAGEVHASMGDWAKFLTDQLNGGFGGRALLPENIYQAMQTASPNSESGYGWGVSSRPWAGGKVLTHEGSNGMNFCVCWLAPMNKFGVLVCCNQGDNEAAKACDDASSALIQRYLAMQNYK